MCQLLHIQSGAGGGGQLFQQLLRGPIQHNPQRPEPRELRPAIQLNGMMCFKIGIDGTVLAGYRAGVALRVRQKLFCRLPAYGMGGNHAVVRADDGSVIKRRSTAGQLTADCLGGRLPPGGQDAGGNLTVPEPAEDLCGKRGRAAVAAQDSIVQIHRNQPDMLEHGYIASDRMRPALFVLQIERAFQLRCRLGVLTFFKQALIIKCCFEPLPGSAWNPGHPVCKL